MTIRRFRRIVTGRNELGDSVIIKDSLAPSDLVRTIHWFTESFPAAFHTPDEVDSGWVPMLPPRGATTFQFFVVPPEYPAKDLETYYADAFGQMKRPEDCAPNDEAPNHPGMHQTATIDYVIMLQGELSLMLSGEEVVLRPFDTVVQLATEHAWINRSTVPALFAAITIDAPHAQRPTDDARGIEIAAMFGLTAAENMLAMALVAGQTLREFAEQRGVAYSTARSHLVHLRMKLDARSQADVVRVVTAAMASLVRA